MPALSAPSSPRLPRPPPCFAHAELRRAIQSYVELCAGKFFSKREISKEEYK